MSNERFTKHYIDIINSTLSDTVLRNITLQANAQFVDELVGEMNAENESLKKQIQEMGEDIQRVITENNTTLIEKQKQIDEFNRTKNEIENVRHQVAHLDTFRNQLVKANKTIEEQSIEIEQLKKTIEDLQSPPKRKKTIALPKALETSIEPDTVQDNSVKDGGTF